MAVFCFRRRNSEKNGFSDRASSGVKPGTVRHMSQASRGLVESFGIPFLSPPSSYVQGSRNRELRMVRIYEWEFPLKVLDSDSETLRGGEPAKVKKQIAGSPSKWQ